MNQPNFDEMDSLMGEDSSARSKSANEYIMDVEPVASSLKQRRVKKSSNPRLIVGLAAVFIAVAVAGAGYFVLSGWASPIVASPEVVAATLGSNVAGGNAQQSLPAMPEIASPSESFSAPLLASEPLPMAVEAPAPQPAKTVADAELLAQMAELKTELETSKAARAATEAELAEAKRRPAQVVSREAATSFVLVETLIDGAVLKDRAGNEVIVPRGSSVKVAGSTLAVGADR